MFKIYSYFSLRLKRKSLRTSLFLLPFFCVLGIQSAAAQVIAADVVIAGNSEVDVACFNLEDFTEADLLTSCEDAEPFESLTIELVTIDGAEGGSMQCLTGTVTVNYSGSTTCGDDFSLDKQVSITNRGLDAVCLEDVTVSCSDEINPSPSMVQTFSPCGGTVNVTIEEVIGELEIDICSEHIRTFKYIVSDDCETLELLQNFTVIPEPVLVDVGATSQPELVSCADEMNVTVDDITIQLPCEAEIIEINFTEPDLSGIAASCNNERHDFSWEVVTTCGTFNRTKSFRVSNTGSQVIAPDDRTISCSSFPLSDADLFEGVFVESPCEGYPESSPIKLFRPNEDLPSESFNEGVDFTYQFIVVDQCTGSDRQANLIITVEPESPAISFDEEVTIINSLDLLEDEAFLLEGVNIDPACCEIEEIFTDIGAVDTENFEIATDISYDVTDECGNTASATKTFIFIPAVSLLEEEVIVECFNIDDFTEADLSTTCAEGFATLNITLSDSIVVPPFQCLRNTAFVRYSGTTVCGDAFVLEQRVNITNSGLTVMVPQDITLSCQDDFTPPTPADVTANSPCGGNVDIQVTEALVLNELCSDNRRRFTYTVSDDCETIVLTQNFLFTQVPLLVDVGPQNVTVECADEIDVSEDDIDIQLPCGAEIIDINFTEPDLSDPTASCNEEVHVFTWEVETTCGNRTITKTFEVSNSGTVFRSPDISISCTEFPLSNQELTSLFVERSCDVEISVQVIPFNEIVEPFCTPTLASYNFVVNDACGNFSSARRSITVNPELPSITFDEEVTMITCFEDLAGMDLLEGVTLDSPCSLITEDVQIGEPVIESTIEGSCDGTIIAIVYSVFDECGNTAEATRTFQTTNPGFTIEIAADEEVACLEAIFPSISDITINNGCGGEDVAISLLGDGELSGCPGAVITFQYDVELSCGENTTLFRDFTIIDVPLEPIVFSEGFVDGSTLIFACGEEDAMDALLNANAVMFESFNCLSIPNRSAIPNLIAEFEKIELPSGDCAVDGRLKRFQFNWTVEDDCGRTGIFTMFADIVDELAPVLIGLPSNVTIGCEEEIPAAPVVTADDNCDDVEVEFTEEMNLLTVGEFNQKVITRTWSSSDECGNTSTEIRSITIIDEESPELSFTNDKGEEIANGSVLIFECGEDLGGLSNLSKEDISTSDNCGCLHPEFEILKESALAPDNGKIVDQFVPTWRVSDEFGNVSEFSFVVQVLDRVAPVFVGADTLYICEDTDKVDGYALDDCGVGFAGFTDMPIAGSEEGVFKRRYIMNDEKQNFSFKDQLVVDFSSSPKLIEFQEGFVVEQQVFSCINDQEQITPYGPENVVSTYTTDISLNIVFEEIVIPSEDEASGLALELRWTAITPCGYSETLTEKVGLIDTIAPQFENFTQAISVDCDSEIPSIQAFDVCGLISLVYQDSILSNQCGYEREILRTYTAIDASGNHSEAIQNISIIDTLPPVFDEAEVICSSMAADSIFAIDPCSNEKILAVVIGESLLFQCAENTVQTRNLMAVDACGNKSYFTQEIYTDNFHLEYKVAEVANEDLLSLPYLEVKSNDATNLQRIRALDEYSMVATDSCGNEFGGAFTKTVVYSQNCSDLHLYTMDLQWFYLDLCGTEYSYNVQIRVLREEIYVEPLIKMSCSAEVPAVQIYGLSPSVPYTETIQDYRDEDGNGELLRHIKIDNYCGNEINLQQTIEYEISFRAAIIGDMSPSCAGINVPYEVEIEGGSAPFDVQWEAAQLCEITPVSALAASISFTEPETAISAIVTDATGCKVISEAAVTCATAEGRSNGLVENDQEVSLELEALPNPFVDQIVIESNGKINTEYAYYLYNHLGQLQQKNQGVFNNDSNILLNMHDYTSGVYYISLVNEGRTKTLKIIKI